LRLYFVCPLTGTGFWESRWELQGRLRVEADASGGRRVAGSVEVNCPVCKDRHEYRVEDLVCPLSRVEPESEFN